MTETEPTLLPVGRRERPRAASQCARCGRGETERTKEKDRLVIHKNNMTVHANTEGFIVRGTRESVVLERLR